MFEPTVDVFEPDTTDLSLTEVLSALGDPVRLQIVHLLSESGEATCGAVELGVSKATRSHHFRVLREAGVTHTRPEGTHRHVSLRADDLEERFPGLLQAVLTGAAEPAAR